MPTIAEALDKDGDLNPQKLKADRKVTLKPVLQQLIANADQDLLEGQVGVASPQMKHLWQQLLDDEREWARDLFLLSQRSRKEFGNNFVDGVVMFHRDLFDDLDGTWQMWSRYETVLRGIWSRILDQGNEYRPINKKRIRKDGSMKSTGSNPIPTSGTGFTVNLGSVNRPGNRPESNGKIQLDDQQKAALEALKIKLGQMK